MYSTVWQKEENHLCEDSDNEALLKVGGNWHGSEEKEWLNAQKIMLQAERREMLSREVTLLPLLEVFAWSDSNLFNKIKMYLLYRI